MAILDKFAQTLMPYAREAEQKTGIPASWLIAMARNETGGDLSNKVLFGIKGTSPSGKSGVFKTKEVENGREVPISAQFATYDDPSQAFAHIVQEMTSARYKDTPKTSPYAFASSLQKKGWATDPSYGSKIARLVREGEEGRAGSPKEKEPEGTPPTPATPPEKTPPGSTPAQFRQREKEAKLQGIAKVIVWLKERIEAKQTERVTVQSTPGFTFTDEYGTSVTPEGTAMLKVIDAEIARYQKDLDDAEQSRLIAEELLPESLADQRQLIEAELAAGTLDLNRAKQRWTEAMDSATAWKDAILGRYEIIEKLGPYLTTPALSAAVETSIRNWNNPRQEIGPVRGPLIPVNFDILSQLKPYLPPPPPDWEKGKGWQGEMAASTAREQEKQRAATEQLAPEQLLPARTPETGLIGRSAELGMYEAGGVKSGRPPEAQEYSSVPETYVNPMVPAWPPPSPGRGVLGGGPPEPGVPPPDWQASMSTATDQQKAQDAAATGPAPMAEAFTQYTGEVLDAQGNPIPPPAWMPEDMKRSYLDKQNEELRKRGRRQTGTSFREMFGGSP